MHAKVENRSSFTLSRPQILVFDYEIHTRTIEGLEAGAGAGISGPSGFNIGAYASTQSGQDFDRLGRLIYIVEPGDYQFGASGLSTFGSYINSTDTHSALASVTSSFILYPDLDSIEIGDFDSDGYVDGSDFLIWQREVGNSLGAELTADENDDGVVDGADLNSWGDMFGRPLPTPEILAAVYPGGALRIPEPASALLVLIGLLAGRRKGVSEEWHS